MIQQTFEDQTFEKVVYTGQKVRATEFQNCTFIKCDCQGADFCNNRFVDCTFEGCNLNTIKLGSSTLNNAVFRNCKVTGVNFSECDDFLFQVMFDNCTVDYSSFMGKKMLKTRFVKSSLKEVNFTQANLGGSVFDGTDLVDAVFNSTNLTEASFVTAFNYTIDPELNPVKKARFSLDGLQGLLRKYAIKVV